MNAGNSNTNITKQYVCQFDRLALRQTLESAALFLYFTLRTYHKMQIYHRKILSLLMVMYRTKLRMSHYIFGILCYCCTAKYKVRG